MKNINWKHGPWVYVDFFYHSTSAERFFSNKTNKKVYISFNFKECMGLIFPCTKTQKKSQAKVRSINKVIELREGGLDILSFKKSPIKKNQKGYLSLEYV